MIDFPPTLARRAGLLAVILVFALCLSAAAQEAFPMEGIFGGNADMEADSQEWELKDGVLTKVIARGNVRLVTDDMDLSSDVFTYDTQANKVIATGRPVKMKQEDLRAECQTFEYAVDEGRATLSGNPVVWQKTEGREVQISGHVLKIIQTPDGRQRVIVEPGQRRASARMRDTQPAAIQMVTEPERREETPATPIDGQRIDATQLDKIPEIQVRD